MRQLRLACRKRDPLVEYGGSLNLWVEGFSDLSPSVRWEKPLISGSRAFWLIANYRTPFAQSCLVQKEKVSPKIMVY